MICAQCRHRFTPKPWPATRAKFCSPPCNRRAWYERNKEWVNQRVQLWCQRNRELRLEVQRRWNATASAKAQKRAWQQAHYQETYDRWKRDGTIKLISARTTSRRRLLRAQPHKRCVCPSPHRGRIECHHRDGNPLNTTLTNLEWRCFHHHRSGHGKLRRPQPQLGVRGSSRRRAPRSDRPS